MEFGGFRGRVLGLSGDKCEVLFDNGVKATLSLGELECAATEAVAELPAAHRGISPGRLVSVVLAALMVCSAALLLPLDRLSRPPVNRSHARAVSRVVSEQAYSGKGYVVIKGTVMNEGDASTKTNLVTGVIAGPDRSSLGMRSVELGPLRAGQWKYFSIKFDTDASAVTNYDVWNLPQ